MSFYIIQNGFVKGEITPQLLGRTDLAQYHQGAFTMRNCFVDYRGGASSRAGTLYVGMCKQPGTAAPPRDIKFQFSINQGLVLEFGDFYMRVKANGAYVTSLVANYNVFSVNSSGLFSSVDFHGLSVGDWIYDTGNTGFSGLTWIVNTVPSSTSFTVTDLFGNAITSATASTTGTVYKIYTVVAPYAAVDLPYLKYTQSADTMSLTCVNTVTGTEYAPYELVRNSDTDWVFSTLNTGSSIIQPNGVFATAQSSTTLSTWYAYVVTAVDSVTGNESVASNVANVNNNDIAIYAGSNTISWVSVPGAAYYNVYKATPSYSIGVYTGSQFGYIGTAYGTLFTDTNISADFNKVPPLHQNPFARGAINFVTVGATGSGYSQATASVTVNTSTGFGAVITPVVSSGAVVSYIVQNGGIGYLSTDTITVNGGVGATGTLSVGPQTGTYPGVVDYYQQRRVYAASLQQPDTYWMSQIGSYDNFDYSTPTNSTDAITGNPWALQVNGIQAFVPMPGGLVTFTGNGTWQINGGSNVALTPSDQTAQAQGYNGCSALIHPIAINYNILYVQAKGSVVRDLAYNFYANIYTGTDRTLLSGHLFADRTIVQWAWAEEPFKIMWLVRDDGALLSLTYLLEQEIYSWARHDTNGLYQCVCSVTEPPVDAVYLIVKRFIRGQWVYYSERMDNRAWETAENCWCVDAGLAYPQTYPQATLNASSATGSSNITSINLVEGGSGYVNPEINAVDPTQSGSGASFSYTLVSGVITNINIVNSGSGYADGTMIQITDSSGVGAIAYPIITNYATFTASYGVFSSANVGNIIRMGGGIATIITYISNTQVIANITQPITNIILNNPNDPPVPAASGDWSISVPTTTVSGLNHLEGQTVSILADGGVQPQAVVTNGTITLQQACSNIVVGLPFTAQLQTVFLDAPDQHTSQGKRKNLYAVTVRVQNSRGLKMGSNQPDASFQQNNANVPWTNLIPFKDRGATTAAGNATPLFTGDQRINIPSNWNTKGQIAIQQDQPLPMTVLACISEYQLGDTSS